MLGEICHVLVWYHIITHKKVKMRIIELFEISYSQKYVFQNICDKPNLPKSHRNFFL